MEPFALPSSFFNQITYYLVYNMIIILRWLIVQGELVKKLPEEPTYKSK